MYSVSFSCAIIVAMQPTTAFAAWMYSRLSSMNPT